ncbi:hypothetical protein [Laspinema olomoucense]|uniref:hypothetical protein n=1 Tax=Laspinema olomoucense TaxID=3231600 RepID=UPI0021BAD8EE|nr:hypothetical protein [Laspinema sp. D3d]MCT7971475.1 hypothetical protein [Laspinema sp. D3d]
MRAISNIKLLYPDSLKNSKNDNISSLMELSWRGDRPCTLTGSLDDALLANRQSLIDSFY